MAGQGWTAEPGAGRGFGERVLGCRGWDSSLCWQPVQGTLAAAGAGGLSAWLDPPVRFGVGSGGAVPGMLTSPDPYPTSPGLEPPSPAPPWVGGNVALNWHPGCATQACLHAGGPVAVTGAGITPSISHR